MKARAKPFLSPFISALFLCPFCLLADTENDIDMVKPMQEEADEIANRDGGHRDRDSLYDENQDLLRGERLGRYNRVPCHRSDCCSKGSCEEYPTHIRE
jgi:hypothetical protein